MLWPERGEIRDREEKTDRLASWWREGKIWMDSKIQAHLEGRWWRG